MNILTLWGDIPLSDVIPPTPEMPTTTPFSSVPEAALDVDAEDKELDEKTNEKGLRKDEQGIVETQTEMQKTEEAILQDTLERSLRETKEIGYSGVTPDSTTLPIADTGTDAQAESSLPPPVILLLGIDAPLEASPPENPEECSTCIGYLGDPIS
uniref:Uncharacterized protein n=1 Tax=Solanum tuberosum TaxID=4113 RepID=M1B7A4_SOLTU